ncbi:MAG: DNA translocase FtsK 4TM domain-containing protein, partial [bacterium]|nr:DNA translocase FtsK 4TM domain-containing protein [bacterium]
MGRRKKLDKRQSTKGSVSPFERVSRETFQTIIGIFAIVAAIFLLLGAFGIAGRGGDLVYRGFFFLFGIGYYLLPLALILLAISFFRHNEGRASLPQILGAMLFFLASLGLTNLVAVEQGGVVGNFLSKPLASMFDVYASGVILIALIVISLLIVFDASLKFDLRAMIKGIFVKKGATTVTDELGIKEASAIDKAVENLAQRPAEAGVKTFNRERRSDELEGFAPLITRKSGKVWAPP